MSFQILIFAFMSVYNFFYLITSLFSSNTNICSYIALTFTLILLSYFPDKMSLWSYYVCNYLISKLIKKDSLRLAITLDTESRKDIILFMNPRVWIYFISIFITAIDSIEKISNSIILNNTFWIQIKPSIFNAVVTTIVVDRFIKTINFNPKCIKLFLAKYFK
jgi:hypothetical protein